MVEPQYDTVDCLNRCVGRVSMFVPFREGESHVLIDF